MRALELSVPQIPSSAAAIDGKSGWASRQQRAERAAGLGATSYMGLRPDTPACVHSAPGYRCGLPMWPHQYRFEAVTRSNGQGAR